MKEFGVRSGGVERCRKDSEEDEFVDAFEHQVEEREFAVALPHSNNTDIMHRRTDSMESYPDVSSESESESSLNEARVYTTKTSPRKSTHRLGTIAHPVRIRSAFQNPFPRIPVDPSVQT